MNWQVQTAKQRFSELVERAVAEGPQIVTKHGRPTVAVVEIGEFRRLSGSSLDFKEFLLSAPDLSILDLERSKDMPREIDFGEER
jgi:prevent-host-death family protein